MIDCLCEEISSGQLRKVMRDGFWCGKKNWSGDGSANRKRRMNGEGIRSARFISHDENENQVRDESRVTDEEQE